MFIFTAPILTIISILGLAFVYALLINTHKIEIIRKLCLSASFAALFIGALAGLSFDKAAAGFQYLASFNYIAEYNSSFALGVDGLSYIFLILTLVTFPFLFLAAWTVSKFPKLFFCHLLAMELLLVLTFVTVDLFYFFILFESLLIPMFILIGVWGARTRKIKAAYYFFLYTLFGSLFMLFGMIYLYQMTGSLNYHVLLAEQLDIDTQKLLWLCFFLAFAVKMPLFPFHIWLPEAHVEAPTVGSMLLASLLLKLGGYGLLRFSLTFLGEASIAFTPLVSTLAIAGVIYGSLSTIRQIDLKRIIAYSSVAHMNLVALGIFSFNRVGIDGAIYLMVAHGVVSAALFFCVGVIYDRTHTRLLHYYGGLVTVMPVFAAFFFIFNLANMGFPGTPNFVGELLMLAGIFALSPAILFFSSWGIVFSAAYSTILFAKTMFGTLKTRFITQFVDVTRREAFILVAFVLSSLTLGLRSDFLLAYVEGATWSIASYNTVAVVSAAAIQRTSVAPTRWGIRTFLKGMLLLKCLVLFLLFSAPQISIMDNLFENPHAIVPLLVLFVPLLSAALSAAGAYIPSRVLLFFVNINCLLLLAVLIYISPTIFKIVLLLTNDLSPQISAVFFEGRYVSTVDRWRRALLAVFLVVSSLAILRSLRKTFLLAFRLNPQPLVLFIFVITNYFLLLVVLGYIFPVVLNSAIPDDENGEFITNWSVCVCIKLFDSYWVLTLDWWRYALLVTVFVYSVFELRVIWEDIRKHDYAVRLISYLTLRTFFLALIVVSSDLIALLIASEGLGLLSYFTMRFWSLNGAPARFAFGLLVINQLADFFLLMAVCVFYLVFDAVELDVISSLGLEVECKPLLLFGYTVPPLVLGSTFLSLWVVGKVIAFGVFAKVPEFVGGVSPAVTFMYATITLTFAALFILHFASLLWAVPPVFPVVLSFAFFSLAVVVFSSYNGPPSV